MTNKEIIELLLRELKLLRSYAPLYVKNAWEDGVDVKHPLNMTRVNNVINIARCHLATRPTKMTTNTNIHFEDWEAEHFEGWVAEQMKDPEFRAAVEELGPAYQATRMEYSKNERAGQLLGFRESGTAVLEPSELGYRCPVCKNALMVEHEYDERLTWSEYNAFLWCGVCNRDFPSCLCVEDIWRAIDLFLASLDAAVRYSYKKRRNNMGRKTLIEMPKLFPTMKLWQHEETGRITAAESQPWKGWLGIPTMYEDELPEDISAEVYSWWFENSFVDGVRIGPKI